MKDIVKYAGYYAVEARDAATGALLWRKKFKNQLTAANQTIRGQMLAGTYSGTGLQIKYFAFGDDITAASPEQTQLGHELYRKQVTQLSTSGANTTSLVSLGVSEALFNIKEIGVFCGSDATSAPGSGTMISRVVVDITHNSNIVLNVTRTDVCALS